MPTLKRIQFIYPRFRRFYQVLAEWYPSFGKRDYDAYAASRTPPCLAFPILAALTPDHIQIDFLDDRIDELDMDNLDADLYCLHIKTEMAPRAYELADRLRAAGKTVILGGLHVTYCPQEAQAHADAICVGDAEGVWQDMLRDFESGALKSVYKRVSPVDMAEVPIPRREIYDRYEYSNPCNYLQVSRGCPLNCSGCPIPAAYGKTIRFRPIELVQKELESMRSETVYMVDDNLFFTGSVYTEYTDKILRVLAQFQKPSSWASAIGLPQRRDAEFLKLAKEANVHSVYNVLFDTLSQRAIEGNQRALDRFREVYNLYREAGIELWLSVYVGTDEHDASFGDKILGFLERVEATLVEFVIPTPFPATPFWDQCRREDRLLHTNWEDFDGLHAVFQPKNFSVEELERLVRDLWAQFYSNHTYIFDRDDVKVLINS